MVFGRIGSKPNSQNSRSKLSKYEDGLRTPLLISWPNQVRTAEHPQLVQAIDVVPTILSAVGLSSLQTDQMLGRDLMPSANGQLPLEERPVFGAIYPNDAQVLGQPARHVRGRWIREGNHKLIIPGPAAKPLHSQLHDLEQDPHELDNLIDHPAKQQVRQHLLTLVDQWWSPKKDVTSSSRP